MANFCSECGAPATGNNFCSECGADLRSTGPRVTPAVEAAPGAAVDPRSTAAVTPEVRVDRYRPSALWTTLAVLWWLFTAFPPAAYEMDRTGESTVLPSLIAVLVVTSALAIVIRLLCLVRRRHQPDFLRIALTSPWVWVIAGAMCVVITSGQQTRGG